MFPILLATFIYPAFGAVVISFFALINHRNICGKNSKWLFISLAFIIAALGYSMTEELGDLQRYYSEILAIETMSLSNVFQFDGEHLYIADCLFYFVSRTENAQILNYIIGLIDYTIVFYVLSDRLNRSTQNFTVWTAIKLCVLIIGIVPFYNIIANVRCVTAYIIILFAGYRDLIQKKRNMFTILLYVLPIGLHVSAVVIVFLRLIQSFAKRLGRSIIFIAIIIPFLIGILYTYAGIISGSFVGSIIANAIGRAYVYLNWTDGGFATEIQNNITNQLTRVYGSFFIGLITIMLVIAKKKSIRILRRDIFSEPMVAYWYTIASCALGSLYIVTGVFWRFEAAVVLFSPIVLIQLLELNDRLINRCVNLLFFSGAFMLAMNLVYTSRNLDVLAMMHNFFLTTGAEILYYVVNGFLNILM